jgi:hypothetical protein
MFFEDTGVWRDIATGVNPEWATPEWADAALDDPGDPGAPVNTRLDGPWGVPWWDGLEDPTAPTGLFASPDVQYPNEAVGASPIVGAYEPAVRTSGPVVGWSHEPSGGLGGDQAIGRIMRFPANIPDRYDPSGVWNVDYRDELASVIALNGQGVVTDSEVTTSLLLYPTS